MAEIIGKSSLSYTRQRVVNDNMLNGIHILIFKTR